MTTTLAESGIGAANSKKFKRLQLLIVAPPGRRKTTIAHSMPRTRTLDFDDGMQSVEWAIRAGVIDKKPEEIVYETILAPKKDDSGLIQVLDRATDQVDEWIEEEDIPEEEWDKSYPQQWDTLIVDSASFMTDASIDLALIENDRLKMSQTLRDKRKHGTTLTPMKIQDWGAASSLFMNAIQQWKALGKNLIITCHEYEKTTDSGLVLAYQPAVIGQLRNKLPAAFDEVWYTRTKGQGDKHVVEFVTGNDSKREAKSRLGCLEHREEADFDKIKKKVAKFYGVKPEQLWTPYHGTAGRDKAEEEESDNAVTI